jgi:opacity protein-like surface antigen
MSSSTLAARILVCALVVAPIPVAAQSVHAQLGIGGSFTFPTSFYHADPAGDGFNQAVHGLALIDLKLPKSPIGLRLDVGTGHNPANDSLRAHLTAAVGAPTDGKTTLSGVLLDVTYNLQPKSAARGYLLAGIGLYHVKFSATSSGATVDTSGTKFAWNVGAGLTVGGNVVAWFLEVRHLDVAAFLGIKPTALVTTTGIRLGFGGSR